MVLADYKLTKGQVICAVIVGMIVAGVALREDGERGGAPTDVPCSTQPTQERSAR